MSLLGANHDRESHVTVSSGLHAPLGPLRLVHAKIAFLQVLEPLLPPFQTDSPPMCGKFAFAVGTHRWCLPSQRVETPRPVFLDGWKNAATPGTTDASRRQSGPAVCFHALPFLTTRFQALLTSLSRCFSPFLRSTNCAIDLRRYLGLGDAVSHILTRIPSYHTRQHPNYPSLFSVRGYHSLWPGVQALVPLARRGCIWGAHTTCPGHFWRDSVWPTGFSFAITHPISVDFCSSRY